MFYYIILYYIMLHDTILYFFNKGKWALRAGIFCLGFFKVLPAQVHPAAFETGQLNPKRKTLPEP